MRPKMTTLTLAVLLVASAPRLHAADKRGLFFFQPAISCGQFISDTAITDVTYRWWLMGWIMAHNRLMPGISSLADENDVRLDGPMLWLHNYCAAHPLDTFGDATIKLIDELAARANHYH